MSLKGGYKIIDLQGYDPINDPEKHIAGLYNEIEGNYGKPFLFSGLVFDDVEKSDAFANEILDDGDYIVNLHGHEFIISDDDVIYDNGEIGIGITYIHKIRIQFEGETFDFAFYSSNGNPLRGVQDLINNRTKLYVGLSGFSTSLYEPVNISSITNTSISLYCSSEGEDYTISTTSELEDFTDNVIII